MTNGANYKRGKLHHSPWHSDIRTPNQLNNCHTLESSAVCTAPPFFVEYLHSRSNRSIPRLLLHMYEEESIPTVLMSNIHIGQCFPKALTLSCLRSYELLEVLLIVRINTSVGLRGILNFSLLRDVFPYRLARGIPLKEGVP